MILRCAVWLLCLVGWPLLAQTTVTLKLEDGGTVAGRVISFKDQYVQLATDSGGGAAVYTNVSWARLSQASLQQLAANRSAAPYASIFLDPPPQEKSTVTAKKITLKEPPRLERPRGGSLFASPVMLMVLLLVYAANVYAGYEIAIFRQWPPALVAGLAAVLPFIAPIIFLALPTRRPHVEEAPVEHEPISLQETPVAIEEAAPVSEQPTGPVLPAAVVYARGQFTFNRRFFETKFAGFLKMVPGEAERDRVIHIKSARGEFTGQRLSKIEPNELFLQIRKGTATEDVMIPFTEIFEVTVKHKDA